MFTRFHLKYASFLIGACLYIVACVGWAGASEGELPPEKQFPAHLLRGKPGEWAKAVLEDYTLVRERDSAFRSNRRVYRYLFERLSLASDMIRVLGFGKYRVTKLPDGAYSIDTGTGVTGRFWIVHDGDDRKILYGTGTYTGWLIRELGGRAAVSLTFRPVREKDEWIMKNHLAVFAKVDNAVVDFLVKALDWLIRLLVRTQLNDASSAAKQLTEAIAHEPDRVYEALKKNPEFPRQALRDFAKTFLGERPPSVNLRLLKGGGPQIQPPSGAIQLLLADGS